MKFNRFDFEQELLKCWNVTDDLDMILEEVLERDLTQDQTANIILGMKTIYEIKFNRLWDMFEAGVKERNIL
jgi:hypothetical protein